MRTHCIAIFAGAASVWIASASALAMPTVGTAIPRFDIRDVTGDRHADTDLRGKPTLLVVMTSRGSSDAASAWLQATERRYGANRVRLVAMVSEHLASIIPTAMVRDVARSRSPRQYWHTTWLDRSGSVGRTLGLPRDAHLPFVFAIDANGVVRASAHRPFDANAAREVWSVMEGSR